MMVMLECFKLLQINIPNLIMLWSLFSHQFLVINEQRLVHFLMERFPLLLPVKLMGELLQFGLFITVFCVTLEVMQFYKYLLIFKYYSYSLIAHTKNQSQLRRRMTLLVQNSRLIFFYNLGFYFMILILNLRMYYKGFSM